MTIFESITKNFVSLDKRKAKSYRAKIGIFQGWVSVLVNGLLFILKLTIGLLVGAVSVIADAIHTLSDVISSGVVIWGFKQSQKPADVDHPYGHGRAEYIATLIIAILLVVAGIEFIQKSIHRIRNPEPISSDSWMIIVLGITILLKEFTARYAEFLSSKIASGTLHADAWHHRTDAISSLLVLVALIAGNYGYSAVDGWAGLGVALFLMFTGYEIAKEAVDDLIGKPPTSEEVDTIRQIVTSVDGVLGAHDITIHSYGHDKFASIHVEIDADSTAAKAHDISELVESRLTDAIGVMPTIHLDPVHPGNPLVKQVQEFLDDNWSKDNRVKNIHDIRVVETENHRVILLGINVRVGMNQVDMVKCRKEMEKSLKSVFDGFDINIKVSSIYQF